jgi:DNA primase
MEAGRAVFPDAVERRAAAPARAYLSRRGLDGERLDRFEIGFAANPATPVGASDGRGRGPALIVEAGLAMPPMTAAPL